MASGRWRRATKAAYKTRIIVRTPVDPKKFNGSVIVEWLNVTAGRDSDPDFGFAGPALLRDGFAYVGVTAQKVGVNGGFAIPIPGYHPKGLVDQNPSRYKSLHHPGDQYSYDIFSQAAQSLLLPAGHNPLGSLHPVRIIADGESQSASRLVTYVDAIAPLTHLFDGYLIHSRGDSGSTLGPTEAGAVPRVTHIRTDLHVPVLMLAARRIYSGSVSTRRSGPTRASFAPGRWPAPPTPTRAHSTTASPPAASGTKRVSCPTSRSCAEASTTGRSDTSFAPRSPR